MMLVVTYDVNTETSEGARRLRAVAKLCERYGMRVQNSVFEVLVDGAQLAALKASLLQPIDIKQDSVRFYRLGNNHSQKIEHYGVIRSVQVEEPMIL